MKKLLLIINPVAGRLTAHTELFDIIEVFCSKGYQVTTQITQHRGHGAELAASAKENGFDLVVCVGGDGTLNETISGLLDNSDTASIPLGYIPAGSTNDFADTLGLSSNPATAAINISKENSTRIDIGKFGNERHFSYIATFGAFSAASYEAPQDLKNAIGHFAYILQGVTELTNLHSVNATITVDGQEYNGDYIFASISNTKSVGGIVKLKDNIVDLNDGLFEVLLIKTPKNLIELNEIVNGALVSKFDSSRFVFLKAKKINIKTKENLIWSLDGERAEGGKEVTIENLPEAIELYK